MPRSFADDPRIDPRIKAHMIDLDGPGLPDLPSREVLLGLMARIPAGTNSLPYLPEVDDDAYEAVAPSAGLRFRTEQVASAPDGNLVTLSIVSPEGAGPRPCVYYVHGGAMMSLSCFDPNYQAWARLVAAHGVTVVMVDFRNALRPSSAPEVAPFPAGLDDCVSAFRRLRERADDLDIDPARIVVAGDSGGANLAIATALRLKAEGDLATVAGLYLLCPYLAGHWPPTPGSSAQENEGILLDLGSNYAAMAYGIEEWERRNPLAWPGFADEDDVAGFPPVVVAVNECDPLRDDGVDFYRLLLRAGVPARCRQAMGTVHGVEVYVLPCPDISRDAARDLAAFCAG